MEDTHRAARLNGLALENAFARRKKIRVAYVENVAVSRGFHGDKPRGEPTLKRLTRD